MQPESSIDTATYTRLRTVLTVSGALDMDTVPHITAATDPLTFGGRTLVLDLAAVTFMDSSGLNALLLLRSRAEAEQGALELRGLPDQALRLLDITGARALFTLTP
ncbi:MULTISPECIES: STAS domain-containing protein [unclassified Streptomyces]|uniref:STAS domain-containing protein n=1 Tax=unclassified Streptomyces TaxID=2593676 RepID=UPI00381F7851